MKGKIAIASKLTEAAQQEVDDAIFNYGLNGIGYHVVKTKCSNCMFRGHTPFKKGDHIRDTLVEAYCIKCGADGGSVTIDEGK